MSGNLNSKSFVVFIDETGHENFLDKNHPVFGMGGCGVMAPNLVRAIEEPWRNIRQIVKGNQNDILHASKLTTAELLHAPAIGDFFRKGEFFRFAAVCSKETKLLNGITPMQAIAKTLVNRIVEVVRWTSCDSVAIIFEHSARAEESIRKEFSGFEFLENGAIIKSDCFFMKKSAAHPALEVADFVMHAVGRQARHQYKGKKDYLRDFQSIFHNIDLKLVSYVNITSAMLN